MTTAAKQRITVSSGLRGSDNAFGVLRLFFATLVIFSHAFPLSGFGKDGVFLLSGGKESMGGVAVIGFFIISGYLITKSGSRNDVLQFLWRRALRIFPAFWVALIVGAFGVALIAWLDMGRPAGAFFTQGPGGPFAYVLGNARLDIVQWGVHDVFLDTPYGETTTTSVLNGSLWTLRYEWKAYLIIGILVLTTVLRHVRVSRWVVTLGLAGLCAAALIPPFAAWLVGNVTGNFADSHFITLTLAFMIGAVIAVWAERIVLDWRVAAIAGVVFATTLLTRGWIALGYAAFAYVIMYAAATLPAWWRRIGAKNDYSYGIYVYGFLIQQATAYLGWHEWGYWVWNVLVVAVTFAFAYASWHLIEKRALGLKDWGPGRGIRGSWAVLTRPFRGAGVTPADELEDASPSAH